MCLDELLDFWLTQLVEPWLGEGFDRVQALRWIQLQHATQHLQRLRCHLSEVASVKSLWLRDVWELKADEPRIFVEKLLLAWWQASENFLNTEKLIDFRLAREESVTISDFSHDASNSPDVHLFAIVVGKEELGGAVPARRDIVGETLPGLVVEDPCEAKVADLQIIVLPNVTDKMDTKGCKKSAQRLYKS